MANEKPQHPNKTHFTLRFASFHPRTPNERDLYLINFHYRIPGEKAKVPITGLMHGQLKGSSIKKQRVRRNLWHIQPKILISLLNFGLLIDRFRLGMREAGMFAREEKRR